VVEAKKASTKEDFMLELDEDEAAGKNGQAAVTHASPAQAAMTAQAEKMMKSQSSDGSGEAVLVETQA
jgi:hypothetical protein